MCILSECVLWIVCAYGRGGQVSPFSSGECSVMGASCRNEINGARQLALPFFVLLRCILLVIYIQDLMKSILCLIIVYGGYVAALWWCYAKSATFSNGVTNRRPAAIRYIALGLCLLGCMALLFHIISDVAWLNSFVWLSRYATPWDMIPYYNTLYIGIAACVLIGLYDPSKEAE